MFGQLKSENEKRMNESSRKRLDINLSSLETSLIISINFIIRVNQSRSGDVKLHPTYTHSSDQNKKQIIVIEMIFLFPHTPPILQFHLNFSSRFFAAQLRGCLSSASQLFPIPMKYILAQQQRRREKIDNKTKSFQYKEMSCCLESMFFISYNF